MLRSVRYDVRLTLDDRGAPTFTSHTVIDFECIDDATSFVNLTAPVLRSVAVNGRELAEQEHRHDGRRMLLPGLRRGDNRVEIVAECAYRSDGVGMHRFRDPVDGAVYLYTNCEPFDAHRVLACFDQPSLKAQLSMHLDTPRGWRVCGNGPVAGSAAGPGRTRWDFATTPPLPPYLFAVVAGDYDVVEGPSHGDVPLALLSRRSLTPYVRDGAGEFFDVTLRGLAYFEKRYGHAYPFGVYNQVFVPEATMGAMENPGCVTFNEMFVFRGPVSRMQTMRRANVILHEMVHVMGFGDVVTMRDWGDLWLNETFATVEATIAADALAIGDAWVDFAGSVKSRALRQDQLSTTHPILVDAPDTESVRTNFDGITYHKGAAVLRQLIAWVGDESYAEGIRSYFKEYMWRNATRADFLAHQSAHSGRDLDAWARLWLDTSGVNTLRAERGGQDGSVGAVTVHQSADAAGGVLRPHRLMVGLYERNGDRLERRAAADVDVTDATAAVDLSGAQGADLLLVNDGDLTFAKLRFDDRSLQTLLSGGVSAIADPLARSLCWTALHDMARDGDLSASAFVTTVVAQAAGETHATLLERVLSLAVVIADDYCADTRRAGALAALAELAAARLRSGDLPLIWVRCLASTAQAQPHLDMLQDLADGKVEVPGLAVDAELRWALLARLATEGRATESAIDAALELDPTDAGRRRALACLAARPRAEAKAQAWESVGDPALSRASLAATLSGFPSGPFGFGGFHAGGRDQAALTEPYVARYLETVPGVWESREYEEAKVITEGLFPHGSVDDATRVDVERVIALPGLPWSARRLLMEGRDGIVRAQHARAADAETT